jgi:hypothetical protein
VPSGVRTTPLTVCGELAGCCAKFKLPQASQNSKSARVLPWSQLKMTFPRADKLARLAARSPAWRAIPLQSGGGAAEISQ